MSEIKNVPLSASRIKKLQTCSWQYYATYKLKLPDQQNQGSIRGQIIHTIFECLGNPRHKKHYDTIIEYDDVFASKSVGRLLSAYAKKHKVDDQVNMDLMCKMTLEGLKYDFFGDRRGKPDEAISEQDFDIEVNEGKKNYRILGFIDKLFLFKKKRLALIRDFKSSKAVFSGEESEDNLQDLMYCLAVKHLYPEYLKREMEFLFLKFDCNKEGLLEMKNISDEELEGFEQFLTQVQKIFNNFDEETAKSNFAYDKGYGSGFTGRVVCGASRVEGELKLDGTPKWNCPSKFPRDYWVLLNDKKEIIASSFLHEKEKLEKKLKDGIGVKIEKRHYLGCPKFFPQKAPKAKDYIDYSDYFL